MDHLCAVLSRGGAAEYDEAELEIFEAGATVDSEYVEVRLEKPVHGAVYLDRSSLCCLYHGMPLIMAWRLLLTVPQVDKLFNPITLLVGPCFVAYIIYKSTRPSDNGGYHLPWW